MLNGPFQRFRPRRVDADTRSLYQESRLAVGDFIWPVFLKKGTGIKEAVVSMPGVFRYSTDLFTKELSPLVGCGLRAVLLFGVPEEKGIEQAWAGSGIVQSSIPIIHSRFPDLEIITDVCLCSYSGDGHCHIGDNDETCEALAKIAVSHARAGANTVAPSAMMDGQVWFIRRALDADGLNDTRIMSYAAKFASNYYGPFRDAAVCAPKSGDRTTYQMDPANGNEALEEIASDLQEGACSVIVKPALSYLDVIARARDRFQCQLIGYNVSAEYSMLYNAVQSGLVREGIIQETLLSIKRAGASRILSYFVPRILPELQPT